jgi:hypothetical protein
VSPPTPLPPSAPGPQRRSRSPLKVVDTSFINRKANVHGLSTSPTAVGFLATQSPRHNVVGRGSRHERSQSARRTALDDAVAKRSALPVQNTTHKLGRSMTCMDSSAMRGRSLRSSRRSLTSTPSLRHAAWEIAKLD